MNKKFRSAVKNKFGENHPYYLIALNNIVDALISFGEYEQALKIYEKNYHTMKVSETSKLSYLLFFVRKYKKSDFFLQKFINYLAFKLLCNTREEYQPNTHKNC